MLIEQLSIAYKCHSSIGNSLNLKEMIHEVLRTFVSESYAIYSEFLIADEFNNLIKIDSFGRIDSFDAKKYLCYTKPLELIVDDNIRVLKINLENGTLFLVFRNIDIDCSFFVSMFESLIQKLNISVNACMNFEKLEKTNELLKEQKTELIKANKTKDDFLANMSHELKTPLNSIIVISSTMAKNKDSKLDETQLKNMKIIKKCSEDLAVLINDILDISKIEAGALKLEIEKIDLKLFIENIFDSFEAVILEKNLILKKEIKALNFQVYSDEKRLSQIIKNFLTNAMKFTNEGFITIKLLEFEKYFQIDIVDTGIGINKENLENIFDRFKQVDDSRSRKYGGAGLGLCISKELASMLNCKLKVKSEISKGSTFSLLIPKNIKEEIIESSNTNNQEILEKRVDKTDLNEILDFKNTQEIYILHLNNVEQFKITIALKKFGFLVHPFFNKEEFFSKIDLLLQNENNIFLIDKDIEDFELIEKRFKYKKNRLLGLNKNENNDELFEKIRNFLSK